MTPRLSVVIIDDEFSARQALQKVLELYLDDTVQVVASTDNLMDGISLIKKHAPNIVFLDISMPQQSGLELFNYFSSISFDVIFVTAHQHYAINAVGLGASSYLLKPVKPQQIVDVVNKIKTKQNSQPQLPAINPHRAYQNSKLLVNHQKGLHIVSHNEIMVIIADGNTCKIIKTNGESLLINRTIGSIEGSLPKNHFFRTHRSYIVNLNYITEIDKEKNLIILSDIETPLASANLKSLVEKLSQSSEMAN